MRSVPILLDLRDVGVNTKGVARVLTELAPRLKQLGPGNYHGVTSPAGADLLSEMWTTQLHVEPLGPQAKWEQLDLPRIARRIGARAVYSHRECGALWGPPLLLHVTEDPEVRWARQINPTPRERARRAYSRALMNRSLRRSRVVTSTAATARLLERHHGLAPDRATTVPLGVDHEKFSPPSTLTDGDRFLFHLGSEDPRERTPEVLDALSLLHNARSDCPRLVVGGNLGDQAAALRARSRRLEIDHLVEFTGRLTDAELASRYGQSIATINASTDEGFGLQPLEAMACGALVVTARSPAVDEVTRDAVTITYDGNATSLSDAIGKALDDPSIRADAASRNPQASHNYTWDATALNIHQILEELATSAG